MTEKTTIITTYIAKDGKVFHDKRLCEQYEDNISIPKLLIDSNRILMSDRDKESIIEYLEMIKGQFDIIDDNNIRKDKICRMLKHVQTRIDSIKYLK